MLDDPEKMKELDSQDMLQVLEEFPDQIEEVVAGSEYNLLPFQPENIVVTGMGGSAIVGDTLKSFLSNRISIPISVNRDYNLPSSVDKDTLLFVVSYSGNTEETLSAAREGLEEDAKVVAISSDGELKEICEEKGIVFIKAPEGYPPRGAFAFLFIPVLQLLSELLIYDSDVAILDAVSELKELRDEIKMDVPTEENRAKKLAKRIKGKVPIIYGHSIYNAVANRWHTQFNENAEILSWFGAFPEMNHNEVVGWKGDDNTSQFIPILLRDEKEAEKINRRIELTKELVFEGEVEDMIEIWTEADTQLARILSLVYLGDYISIYLALLRGKNPSPVKIIDELKENL
ncbi:MAG: bifunctional phosphoglucose/phosphomannose isomerase [Candidatus Thermoplasmatota archaeon]|nr:bifunctional phosphoglucose/phosphomannose isomerase [Candidatus Thermoplasmatota archaeon]